MPEILSTLVDAITVGGRAAVIGPVLAFLGTLFIILYIDTRNAISHVNLIYQCAKVGGYDQLQIKEALRLINKGKPFGESSDMLYTPIGLPTSRSDVLFVPSFEQVSRAFRYLRSEKEQESLLQYYYYQSQMDHFMELMNTDYFRGLTQARKAYIFDGYYRGLVDNLKEAITHLVNRIKTRRIMEIIKRAILLILIPIVTIGAVISFLALFNLPVMK